MGLLFSAICTVVLIVAMIVFFGMIHAMTEPDARPETEKRAVTLLFEHDGCKVYEFHAHYGRFGYFAKCGDNR